MKRVLVGFWLFVCILLLSGYSELYAHTQTSTVAEIIQTTNGPFVKLSMPDSEGGMHNIEVPAIEEEDDQFNTFKKYLQSRYQFAAIFLAQALKDLLSDNAHCSGSPGSDCYAVTQLSHAVLQVFRI